MKKTAFVSVSFQHRQALAPVTAAIVEAIHACGMDAHVFVDVYAFAASDEARMMQVACRDIARSALLIAEVSHKAIGVGVEVGYAVGLGKPVVYLRHVDAPHSTTVAGVSTHKIIYSTPEDAKNQLVSLLSGEVERS